MDEILKYFPSLTDTQRRQFTALRELYGTWNEKINVISRRDIRQSVREPCAPLSVNSPLHNSGSVDTIRGFGLRRGFPEFLWPSFGPNAHFTLIDRIGKKVRVASEIAAATGLDNCTFQHGDSGECREKFDYVVSRAVMTLPDLVKASAHMSDRKQNPLNRLPNGLICLKGGDLDSEIQATPHSRDILQVPLSDFLTKSILKPKVSYT